MAEITRLDDHRPGKWLSGMATCIVCQCQFAAVVPVGEDFVECPNCHLMFGVLDPVMPAPYWQCNCGCALFAVSTDGYHCVRCGTHQQGF